MKEGILFLGALCLFLTSAMAQNNGGKGTTTPKASTTSTPTVSTPTKAAAAVSADCKRVGTSVDKFEQNNAVFELLENEKTEQKWLKITTKDGGCNIIDLTNNDKRESVRFEDWDKDGLKDLINESKWNYQVQLFNAKTNDFSRPIDGFFSGEQWDYDKTQGLKYQFLEGKMGGNYELYKISNLKKLVYSEISLQDSGDGEKYDVKIANRKGGTDASLDRIAVPTPPALIKAINGGGDKKAAVADYWRKNEAVFVPKTSTPSVSTTPQAATASADCKKVGTSIEKFEQNNAVFERLENEKTAQQWLKITTKDGGCRIIDLTKNDKRESVRFADWDNDGLKDWLNYSRWTYEVQLFDAKTNDFSRPIDGFFSGEQWDYDKTRGLKYQFIENKTGGRYELYKISNFKKLVYSEISLKDLSGDGEKYDVKIANRKGGTDASTERIAVPTPPALIKAINEEGGNINNGAGDKKVPVADYWRKNEAVFVPK